MAQKTLNVAFISLGCPKNLVDTEIMAGLYTKANYRIVSDPKQAEIIVVNTCAFLSSAVEESIDVILEMSELKHTGICSRLIVAGCLVERYGQEMAHELPEVDRFISVDEIPDIVSLHSGCSCIGCSCSKETATPHKNPSFLYDETMPRLISTPPHMAYIKIADGCHRPCSFCIIPKLRGKYRSRTSKSIINEARKLLDSGVKELNLIAQDLTAYGVDNKELQKPPHALISLLSELSSINECNQQSSTYPPYWIRLLYAYPLGVTKELITCIKDSPVICDYLDIPLQHISHKVLRAMRRPLGEKGTRSLIESVRTWHKDIALRTAFIVGFPGETEANIQELEAFVKEGHFTHLGVFTYSPEELSTAYKLEDTIPQKEKEARKEIIMQAQQEVVAKRLKTLIGTKVPVLVEGTHPESNLLLLARTQWQAPEVDSAVIINRLDIDNDEESSIQMPIAGQFGIATITEIAGYDLTGTLSL